VAPGSSGQMAPARSKIQVAKSERPDWYYLVNCDDEDVPRVKVLPGAYEKNRILYLHRSLVHVMNDAEIVFERSPGDSPDRSYAPQLRQYQWDAFDFMYARAGTINADDLGLGKSLEALTTATSTRLKPVIVVGTLLSRGVWCGPASEPKKWYGIEVKPLTSRRNASGEVFDEPNDGWFFCHYDILEAWMPWIFTKLRPKIVIFDEAHHATPKTRRGRAASSIARLASVEKRIVLTATPVRNKRIELWALLDLAEPYSFGDRHSFGLRYCNGMHGEYGWTYAGESHNEELKLRLADVMIRRTKDEVMAELPALTRQHINVELDEADQNEYAKYKAAELDIRAFLKSEGRGLVNGITGERLVQLTTMLGILSRVKRDIAVELAETAAKTAGKVVVFAWFKNSAREIAKALKAGGVTVFGPITGEDSIEKRIDCATAFAAEPVTSPAAFVSTLAAASESINQLATCQELIIADLYWKPSVLLQAEGRLHRSGQIKPVHVQYLVAENTVDEDLITALFTKAEAIESVGIVSDTGEFVKTLSTKMPDDDLSSFVNQVTAMIDAGGYGIDE